ncbi:uncharacterized protein LOC133319449 [Danaus plexippus]|uniref:uncharacterized protein LOC133319449 n=1 Tax=Danaus plexippus TaxID=13037 RepID=UPI002AB23679|nr:uncharacterized protein LOC133319449 [Danaus plexippus]
MVKAKVTSYVESTQRKQFKVYISSLNFPLLLNFFLFYSIYCRLKKLRDVVQNNCLNIVSCQFLYKFLIDSTEKGKKVYDFLLFLTIIIQIPEIMQFICYEIFFDKNRFTPTQILYDAILCFYVLQYMILIFLPAFFSTMLSKEARKLKLILLEILVNKRDSVYKKDIQRFVEYIKARPFQLYVLHFIPLDYKFPFFVMNIYLTYTITIAQFSRKG